MRRVEITPVEGRGYAMITILEGDRADFVGIVEFSPNGHFRLAVGTRLALRDDVAVFLVDDRELWTMPVQHPIDVHVTDHGVAAFVDAQSLVIVDMKGLVLRKPFGPPWLISAFEVRPDGFHIRAGRTTWRADYDGNVNRLD